MAKNRPVRIWAVRHNPRREPKFHQVEMLRGAGISTIDELNNFAAELIFRRGRWIFRISILQK